MFTTKSDENVHLGMVDDQLNALGTAKKANDQSDSDCEGDEEVFSPAAPSICSCNHENVPINCFFGLYLQFGRSYYALT